MMAAKAIRHGTARDETDRAAIGYCSSGESIWSRSQANPKGDGRRERRRAYSTGEEIDSSMKALPKLHEKVRHETDPVRLEKLKLNICIKTKWIEQLSNEKHR
jgi:hypothetical protein